MKANAPKRKVFDAVDVLMGEEEVRNSGDIRMLAVDGIACHSFLWLSCKFVCQ